MSTPVSELGRMYLTKGNCPTCGSRGFVIGPQSNVTMNIECANLQCRSRFNVTMVSGTVAAAELIAAEKVSGARWPSSP